MVKLHYSNSMRKDRGSHRLIGTLLILVLMMNDVYAETSSMLDSATCLNPADFAPAFPCENLIDASKLWEYSKTTGSPNYDHHMAYSFQTPQTIRTVYIGNREDVCGSNCIERIHESAITVGTNLDPYQNTVCSGTVTAGGWYECSTDLTGNVLSIGRTYTDSTSIYNLKTMRAYSGRNVAQFATIESEP